MSNAVSFPYHPSNSGETEGVLPYLPVALHLEEQVVQVAALLDLLCLLVEMTQGRPPPSSLPASDLYPGINRRIRCASLSPMYKLPSEATKAP
jgi:hypothetical protein